MPLSRSLNVRFVPKRLVLALAVLGTCVAPAALPVAAATPDEEVRVAEYVIPPGPLGAALIRFAGEAGVQLSASGELTAGMQSPGLRGRHTVRSGFEALLAGTGLELVRHSAGHYTLRRSVGVAAPTVLTPVLVTARTLDARSEGSGRYAASGATLLKGAQALRDIPQSVSVFTRQRIEDQGLVTVENVLEQTPGVTSEAFGTVQSSFYARGFTLLGQSGNAVQVDGLTMGSNNFTIPAADLAMYDRVEILRGAAGLLAGAGQPAGLVNMVRKRPTSEFALQGGVSVGSWDQRRVEMDVGGPLTESGRLRGRFVAAAGERDYFFDHARREDQTFYGVLQANLAPRTTLTAGAYRQRADTLPYLQGMPRYSDGTDLGLARSSFLNADWGRWDLRATTLFADLEHRFANGWEARLSYGRTLGESHLKYGYVTGAIDPMTGAGARFAGFDNRYDNRQTSVEASLSGDFMLAGHRHEVVLGANWQDFIFDNQIVNLPQQPVDIFTWDPGSIPEPASPAPSFDDRTRIRQHALFGTLRYRLADPLRLIAGARISTWKTRGVDRIFDEVFSDYGRSGQFTPYAGLIYDVHPDWSLYASYTDIFQPQSQFDIDGRVLDPIFGRSYEAGVKTDLRDGRLTASAAVFRIDEVNRAVVDADAPDPCPGAPTGGACYVAGGERRSQGVEAELTGEIARGWQLSASYTFTDTEIRRAASGQGQPIQTFMPRHLFKLWSNYQLPGTAQRWSVGGGVTMQSEIYTETSGVRITQPGYTLASLRIGYRFDRHWAAALHVNNLFDKVYYRRLGSPNSGNYYGDPRSFMLTVRGAF